MKDSEKVRGSKGVPFAQMIMLSLLLALVTGVLGTYLGHQRGYSDGATDAEASCAKQIASEIETYEKDLVGGSKMEIALRGFLIDGLKDRLMPASRRTRPMYVPLGLYLEGKRDPTHADVQAFVRSKLKVAMDNRGYDEED
jgi:hypothetical protein